jgi:hypothetical protein
MDICCMQMQNKNWSVITNYLIHTRVETLQLCQTIVPFIAYISPTITVQKKRTNKLFDNNCRIPIWRLEPQRNIHNLQPPA